MKPAGWWSVVVTAVTATLAVFLWVSGHTPQDAWGAWAALGLFIVAFAAYGRIAVATERAPHDLVYTLVNAAILALGTAHQPMMATLQTVMYPLVWYTASSVRRAWLLNPLIALGALVGLWIFSGWDDPWFAIVTAGLSLAFSLGMGAWISSMVRHGEERSRLLDELEAVQGQLAVRNHEAGAASERERIARELHDTIAQNLTAIVMQTQRLEKARGAGREVGADSLALIESLASEALTETRTLVATTTPVPIETGVEDALRRLADRFERETGVTVALSGVAALDREREVIVLRCAQEALANVRKHAQAKAVDVRVDQSGDTVILTVQDDGIGLPAHARDGVELGFGLTGMRSRLAQVGGTLALTSDGGGTRLTATLPVGATGEAS